MAWDLSISQDNLVAKEKVAGNPLGDRKGKLEVIGKQ